MTVHRVSVAVAIVALLSGCGGAFAVPSPTPLTTAGATAAASPIQPSFAPTAFPASAFGSLVEDPVSAALASKLQSALASTVPQ